jgi:hypothetical protein
MGRVLLLPTVLSLDLVVRNTTDLGFRRILPRGIR